MGSALASDESLIYTLPGFSQESGIKVGVLFSDATEEVEATNASLSVVTPRLFSASTPGNASDFSVCLRFKAHYHRPEYILFGSYKENKTAVVIGVDETAGEIYFKYAVSDDSAELARLSFEWLPRLDTWEHICFVKKPDPNEKLKQVKFFVNGKPMGQGRQRHFKKALT